MALVKAINPGKRSLGRGIDYIKNPEKTEENLISGKDCDAQTALEEMKATKEIYGKTEGRQYKHFVQSFSPDDPLDASKAHQIGYEMAQKAFPGYEVLVATHTDTNHLHNHIIVNSVSFENGEKYRQSTHDLQNIKELSDRICEREGLRVMTKEDQTPNKSLSMNEYQVAVKGSSWKFKLMAEIDNSMENSKGKEEFVKAMEDKGYQVKWTDERKNITYTTPDGHKVRDNKLHDQKYLKEEMESGFERAQENQLLPDLSDPGRGNTTINGHTNGSRSPGDIGTDIIFGKLDKRDNRADQISRERNVGSGGIGKKEDVTKRSGLGRAGAEVNGSRSSAGRTASESEQNRSGFENGAKGTEGKRISQTEGTRSSIKNDQQRSTSKPRDLQDVHKSDNGSSSGSKQNIKPNLAGKIKAVRNESSDLDWIDNSSPGSVPSGDPSEQALDKAGKKKAQVNKKSSQNREDEFER
ncbi:hypothetical protein SBF1_750002 [Candidatus Desulfosporosinus infrequens]|uniref:MobA/VirD2-like nuclease domain-containing protein n=1 Tax=Candidatus Desulfosporosinus infrequens TaxID=2043169 RepID=A0A2U3LR74_9FIRM|nr:hypothetical protein SBF1_750002 [Candidatus Desulfosporosinus infrequens]